MVTVAPLDLVRITDHCIREQWGGPDQLDLHRQLGRDGAEAVLPRTPHH